MPSTTERNATLNRVSRWLGIATATVAGIVLLLGWFAGIQQLRALIPGASSMKVNTAISLIALGLALAIIASRRSRPIACALIFCSFALGAVSITEYLFAFGGTAFDEWLLPDPATATIGGHPGRTGFATSVAFILLSISLTLFVARRAVITAQILAACAGSIGYLATIGYVMSASNVVAPSAQWTQMAVHTALAVIAVSLGALLLRPDAGFVRTINAPEGGGRQARLLIPAVLLIGIGAALIVRFLANVDVPSPIPSQIVTSAFVVLMIIVIILGSRQVNRLERDRNRRALVSIAIDSALDGILIVDRDGRITVANDAISAMTGYRPQQLIGMQIEQLVPETHRGRHSQDREAFWQEGISRRMSPGLETVIIDATGRQRPVEVGLGLVDLGYGPESVIATVRDTSEISRANQELEQFAYVASHDLRAPLRAIVGFGGLLSSSLDSTTLNPEQQEFLAEMIDGARRMDQLIVALLNFSRIGRNTERTDVNVADQVRRAIATASTETSVDLSGLVDMQVPADLYWHVNEALMDSALANVLSNSIKYASSERALAVTIEASQVGNVKVLSITDNGQGIQPDQIDRATLMFQRLTTTGEGVGIGLASVKRIAEQHGGTLSLTSDGRTYTTATITIPDDFTTTGGKH